MAQTTKVNADRLTAALAPRSGVTMAARKNHGDMGAKRAKAPAHDGAAKPDRPTQVARRGRTVAGDASAAQNKAFAALMTRDPAVARAVALLQQEGALTGARSKKVSTRVDPGVLAAAKKRFGLSTESDVINASLALAAAPDRFKAWLRDNKDRLTDDFELPI
jgi:hypothetical protein